MKLIDSDSIRLLNRSLVYEIYKAMTNDIISSDSPLKVSSLVVIRSIDIKRSSTVFYFFINIWPYIGIKNRLRKFEL